MTTENNCPEIMDTCQETQEIPIAPHRRLINAVETWQYGESHTHNEIEEITGVQYQITTSLDTIEINRKYCSVISKANKILLRRGRLLNSVKGVGYELLEHREYCIASAKKVNEAKNKARKALLIIENTERGRLNIDEQVRHDSIAARVLPFYRIANETSQAINNIVYPLPNETTPRSMGRYTQREEET